MPAVQFDDAVQRSQRGSFPTADAQEVERRSTTPGPRPTGQEQRLLLQFLKGRVEPVGSREPEGSGLHLRLRDRPLTHPAFPQPPPVIRRFVVNALTAMDGAGVDVSVRGIHERTRGPRGTADSIDQIGDTVLGFRTVQLVIGLGIRRDRCGTGQLRRPRIRIRIRGHCRP